MHEVSTLEQHTSDINMDKDIAAVDPLVAERAGPEISGLRKYATNPFTLGLWKILLNGFYPVYLVLNIAWIVYVAKYGGDGIIIATACFDSLNVMFYIPLTNFITTPQIDDFCITLDGKIEFYAQIIRYRPNNSLKSWDVVCVHMNTFFSENGTMFRFVNGYHCLRLYHHWRRQAEQNRANRQPVDSERSDYLEKVRKTAAKIISESEESYWESRYPDLGVGSSSTPE
ncbi:hypothetical protein DAKH74_058070 [Maudiozyma humilis]|uniref:Uncharacterized protein n=1 Tax=Maudiozyma humilis TaxID=51915 RepID=A0AAV5S725_MAUHU|nr:hypothetical protein DAKH74_058070 [Kazachstania humilis]